MIAPDHDGRLDFAAPDEFVDGHAELRPLAVTQPADPGRQSLVMNPFLRQLHPASQRFVLRKQLERETIRARDVGGISAQRHPAKRSATFAEERANVFRNEAGNDKGIRHAAFLSLRPNVIAVIKRDGALLLQIEHGLHMDSHGLHGTLHILVRVTSPQREGLRQAETVGYVTIERVVRARLIRQHIWSDVAPQQFRQNVRAIPDQPDRHGLAGLARLCHKLQRRIERPGNLVAIPAL